MKNTILLVLIATIALVSCDSRMKKAENAVDAGREFVRASLNGDIDRAKFYLYKDSSNVFLFDKWKTNVYQKLSVEEKREYRESSINMIELTNVDDSTMHFVYSNSYKPKDTTSITVLKIDGEWLVDLKTVH
ncbi:nuclear transport factor 2 family protein [Gynurincola endophyticus]|jgi:hypothetical protein|uniref:DUF4878 domain-containing protein n=1 Tax=Gynurincola endophyticus TaxID=2479004 RepID=UPI000F8C61E4|nr:DUF4878 domain-containing protein [Gynurincola endophyticus]